jgi:hypothetical protein
VDTTTTTPSAAITCARPGCGNSTTLAESVYIDRYGRVCPGCTSPLPAWAYEIEPPF